MLSSSLRTLTLILAAVYAQLGLILFLAPEGSSAHFAWNVSAWVTMTIGAWCLGTAYIAWKSTRNWKWPAIYPCLVYLWVFGLVQTLVLVMFREKLLLDSSIAWAYILAITLNLICSVFGIIQWHRTRPEIKREGPFVSSLVHNGIIVGVVTVGLIVLATIVGADSVVDGRTLPEKMGLFSLRAFSMFYLSIFLGGATLIGARGMTPIVNYAEGGLALTIPITLASIIYLRNADFAKHPAGLAYIVIYLVVIVVAGAVVYFARKKNSV